MNEIKLIIGSRKFPGFYESVFSNSDDFFEEEKELETSLRIHTGKKINVEYEYTDLEKYMLDISKEYLISYVDKINEGLDDLTDDSLFEMDEEIILIRSPKYYNYSNDECFTEVKTNYETLEHIKKYVLKQPTIDKYIYKCFKPGNGEFSEVPYNIEQWKIKIEKYDIDMIIRLLDMFLHFKDKEGAFDYLETVWTSIIREAIENNNPKICYAEPILSYNGKTYHI